jgi:ADP-ribose pyrophosphatase YjhB (NUDIX family)
MITSNDLPGHFITVQQKERHIDMETTDQDQARERTMITFSTPPYKFTYRIGGIAIHNGRILCQKSTVYPQDIYWFLPGGRAELGESAEETLYREMQEELGEHVQVGRLLYIIENFFTNSAQHHELSLYFEITFPTDSYLYRDDLTSIQRPEEDDLPLIFDWLPIADLPQTQRIRPSFFNTALHTRPTSTRHIVIDNGKMREQ